MDSTTSWALINSVIFCKHFHHQQSITHALWCTDLSCAWDRTFLLRQSRSLQPTSFANFSPSNLAFPTVFRVMEKGSLSRIAWNVKEKRLFSSIYRQGMLIQRPLIHALFLHFSSWSSCIIIIFFMCSIWCTCHWQYLAEQASTLYAAHVHSSRDGSCTLTPECHLIWISTEVGNIVLDPLQCQSLVLGMGMKTAQFSIAIIIYKLPVEYILLWGHSFPLGQSRRCHRLEILMPRGDSWQSLPLWK